MNRPAGDRRSPSTVPLARRTGRTVLDRAVRYATCALGACIASFMPSALQAQTYPNKPIRMIVPFPPRCDRHRARLVVHKLGEATGQG